MTMIDGQTFGVISDTCTQKCGIYGATAKMTIQLVTIWSLQVNLICFSTEFQIFMHGYGVWIVAYISSRHIFLSSRIKKVADRK